MKNRLGLPVSVWHSETFSPVSKESIEHIVELQDGESLHMDYSVTAHSDQFSAMTSLNEKDYYIKPSKLYVTIKLYFNGTVYSTWNLMKKSLQV